MESIFCMHFSASLKEVAKQVQSTQNRKLVIFFQYIKKKMSQLSQCSFVMQNIQIFYGGSVTFVVTCSNINYGLLLWHSSTKKVQNKIKKIQERCLCVVLNNYSSNYSELLQRSGSVFLVVVLAITCSKLTIETLEKGGKYVQS